MPVGEETNLLVAGAPFHNCTQSSKGILACNLKQRMENCDKELSEACPLELFIAPSSALTSGVHSSYIF